MVANLKNLKVHAKELLGNEYTAEKQKELIDLCTKKSVQDYQERGVHKSFAIHEYLKKINKVLGTFGVEYAEHIPYCNTGDSYKLTIYYYKGKLRIGDIGTAIERGLKGEE